MKKLFKYLRKQLLCEVGVHNFEFTYIYSKIEDDFYHVKLTCSGCDKYVSKQCKQIALPSGYKLIK
jgi:hypothetical protein